MVKRQGSFSYSIILIIFAILLGLGVVISISSIRTVVSTTAYVERIAQGDTVLFTLLESRRCTPLGTKVPLKFAISVGLASGGANPVELNYGGIKGEVDVEGCVREFMQSLNIGHYRFFAYYGGEEYVVESDYETDVPKRTERIYLSIPDGTKGVADITFNTNLPDRGDEVCPEEEETHFCTPEIYCLIAGSACNYDYLCGGGTCCCPKAW